MSDLVKNLPVDNTSSNDDPNVIQFLKSVFGEEKSFPSFSEIKNSIVCVVDLILVLLSRPFIEKMTKNDTLIITLQVTLFIVILAIYKYVYRVS